MGERFSGTIETPPWIPIAFCPPAPPFTLLLLALSAPQASQAAVEAPWNLPALSAKPEDVLLAAAASPAPKDGDVEMLFEEHVYRFDEQGRQHRTLRRVYRYLTDKGVDDWSCAEAEWSPWCEEKPIFRVRVITPDAEAHAIDQESIGEAPTEQDAPNMFSDQKLLRGPLPAIVVGAVVEEEIETNEVRPLFDRGVVERFLLSQQYAVRKLRLVIDAPSALPLKYEVVGSDARPLRTEDKGLRHAGLRSRSAAGLGNARGIPAGRRDKVVADRVFHGEVVERRGRGLRGPRRIAPRLGCGPAAGPEGDRPGNRPRQDRRAAAGLGAEPDPLYGRGVRQGRDRSPLLAGDARPALWRLQGPGDALGGHAPRGRHPGPNRPPADRALRRRRAALPGLGDFDHAIVCIPGDRPMWIDPSARCAPAGWLPLVDQGRWAMLAAPETSGLIHTPSMDYALNTSEQVIELYPSEQGRGRVRVTVTCGGSCEEDLREDYATLGIKALRKRWKEHLKEQFHAQASPRLEFSSPLDLAKPFRVTAEAPDAKVGQFDEAAATVSLQPDGLFQRLPGLFRGEQAEEDDNSGGRDGGAPSDERKGPLLLPEPHIRQLQYRIHLPAGFAPTALPAPSVKQHGPATISQKYEMSGEDLIVATFRIDTGPGRFTADEAEDLRQAIGGLAKDENSPWEVKIGLQNAAARHMAAGRVAEALAQARADLDRHADRADQHSHYSRLLMQAGLGEAARAEACRAVELAPHSAAAYANLARVLAYDLLGRHFRRGMDWTGAAEAYRKALELDPSDVASRMDYAILLEHDSDGLRYAPGTRLEEAIDEYRKAQRQLGPRNRLDSLELNLALALLFSEKYAELEKLATQGVPRAEKATVWRGLLVAAVAARHGVSDADRKSTEITADAGGRREILQDAAEYLQQARLYAQAAALYEAAAEGSSDREPAAKEVKATTGSFNPEPAATEGSLNADGYTLAGAATEQKKPQGSAKGDELRKKAKAFAAMRRMGEAELDADPPRRVVQQLFAAGLSGCETRQRIPALFVSTASSAEIAVALDALQRAVRPALETARENQVPPLRIVNGVLQQATITVEGDAATGFRVRVSGEQLNDSTWHVVMEGGQARLLRPVARTSTQRTTELNNQAWAAVASGEADERALDEALLAVKRTRQENAACLHTLAAVYAEMGKTF